MTPERTSIRVHLVYVTVIGILLIIIGMQSLSFVWETTVAIPGREHGQDYTLRMLGSGDLIFEKHRFLPLAAYRDYWGDMTVAAVKWLDDRNVAITMSDGTRLDVSLGDIRIRPAGAYGTEESAHLP